MSQVDKNKTLPAVRPEDADGEENAKPGRLLSLTAMICGVLRTARRYSWLDREVYNQTLVLQEVIAEMSQDSPVCLDFSDTAIQMGEEVMDELPRAVRQFQAMVRRKSIRTLEFSNELAVGEVMRLFRLLQNKNSLISHEERAAFDNIHVKHDIGEGSIELPEEGAFDINLNEGRSPFTKILDKGAETGDEVRNLVADITGAIDAIALAKEERQGQVAGTTPLKQLAGHLGQATEVTLILASLRAHDSYTYDHSINVGLLSIALARYVGWRGRDLQEFGVAALIHDVGKLYTPLEVLNKPGRFTPQEWIVMRRHPSDGADILREAGVGSDLAPKIAIEHHTNPDGTGYPPLPYDELHPGSKMVKIADCYDAFTTIRPYRSQARPFEVLKMLRKQAGTLFDGELIEAFCDMMGVYPIGSVVQLASGVIGIVVQTNGELKDRPVVRVLQEQNSRKPKETRLIDLAETDPDSGAFLDEVVDCVDPVIRNIPVGRYI